MRELSSGKLSGVLLILAFLMLVVGGIAAPSGAYQGAIEERLAIIDANQAQWIVSKVLDGSAVAFMGAGGVILAIGLRRRSWLGVTGGTSLGAAGIVGLVYVYRLATDPGPLYDRAVPVPTVIVLVALTAIGLLGLGLCFLLAGYPRWASLIGTVAGVGALIGLAPILILRPGPEPVFAVEAFAFVGILSIGIMLVRQRGQRPVGAADKARVDGNA